MTGVRTVFLALVVSLSIGASAEAAPITLAGGSAGTIPGLGINEFIGVLFAGPEIGGYYGSQVLVSAPEGATLTFDFYGAEAGFLNAFTYNGSELFSHPGGQIISTSLGSPLASYSAPISGTSVLPFSFNINGNSVSIVNGYNPNDVNGQAAANFFATCDPTSGVAGGGGRTCDSVFLFLDDGGAGPDDNHDDFLVRATVTVPEPATALMLGIGAFGLVGFRRNRRS